jgi:hypothetical protein
MFDVRHVTAANAAELAHWCGGRLVEEKNDEDPSKTQPGINVPTGGTVTRACLGDVIIEHNGQFSVQKH